MIDILSISKDSSRLAQIVRSIGECGNYRTTRTLGSPTQLAQRGDGLDSFDVLIVDALELDDAELAVIADLSRRHERLTCILLTPDASPQTLIAAMRAGFRDVLSWPLDQQSLSEALLRAESKRSLSGARNTRIVSFVSCKGGTGTTLIASNIAHEISLQRPNRVLLVDLNQLYGDAAFLVTGEPPPSTLPQMCAQVERMDSGFLDASLLHVSETFHVLAGAGDPVKAGEIDHDRLEWILGVAVPHYDFVVFDVGQSINPLSMLALDRSDEIHMVLQASMPHVRAGRRLREILGSLGYASDTLRLVVNRYTRDSERARTALEEVLDMSPYQVLPEDGDVVNRALDEGVPISDVKRTGALSRGLQQLAQNIVAGVPAPTRGRARPETRSLRFFGRSAAPKLKTM
jgi:pilus assembly protein CpaE